MSRLKTSHVLGAATLLLLQACVIHVNADGRRDIDRVFGSIEVEQGRSVGDIGSVNGSIELEDRVTAEEVETVNGSIKIRDDVSVASLETVNGGIRAGDNLSVSGSVKTVNGGIRLVRGTAVKKDVSTVNGDIQLEKTRIEGNVETVNGDIRVLKGSVIEGDVVFEENHSWPKWSRSKPKLVVDRDSEIRGAIRLYQEVNLDIEDGAKIGKIIERY